MKRLLHIGLLLMALLGLMGQSTAMAMTPARVTGMATQESLQISMAAMDCTDMATAPGPGKAPCKKITLQCMAAMGCAPVALVEPVESSAPPLAIEQVKSALPLAARLWGRSYGPEPDPPSILI